MWLNQNVDVVNPGTRIQCNDVPTFEFEGITYFGYRICFRFYQPVQGQWWLEEWRGALGVRMRGLEV